VIADIAMNKKNNIVNSSGIVPFQGNNNNNNNNNNSGAIVLSDNNQTRLALSQLYVNF
jgi:hypothetical protein